MNFAQIAKDLREEKGLTQKQLSTVLGLSASGIGHLELGEREPSSLSLIAYAKYFNVSVDYLLGLEDDFGTPTVAAMNEGGATEQERELLRCFRELSPYLKGVALDTVRSWADKEGSASLNKKA